MSPLRKLMHIAAFPVVLTACGDDVVEPGNELTESEAVALLKKTGGLLFGSRITLESEDSLVGACAQGGSATAVGKLPDEEFAGDTVRLVIDYQITPSDCRVTHDGLQFTINGGPDFRFYFGGESVGSDGEVDIDASVSGGVKWQLEDRSGSCPMRVTLVDPRFNDGQIEGSYKGMFCGYDVEIDATEFLPADW